MGAAREAGGEPWGVEGEGCRESRTGKGRAPPQAALGPGKTRTEVFLCMELQGSLVTATLARAGWAERPGGGPKRGRGGGMGAQR